MKNKLFHLAFTILIFIFLTSIVSAGVFEADVTFNEEEIQDPVFYVNALRCIKNESQISSKITSEMGVTSEFNVKEYDSEKDCYWAPSFLIFFKEECRQSKCSLNMPRLDDLIFYRGGLDKIKTRLAFYIPSQEQTFISEEFNFENRISNYEINLLPDGKVEMRETTPFLKKDFGRSIMPFFIALLITLILELTFALIFLSKFKDKKRRILFYLFIANLISLPIVWFVFPLIIGRMIILAGIFLILFEGYFIHLTNKKIISLRKSLGLSTAVNLISFFFLVIFLIIMFFMSRV